MENRYIKIAEVLKRMSHIWFVLLLPGFLLSSCETKDKTSDAYGNFELDKTIISSKSMGEIWYLDIYEGMSLEAKSVIGQIDTVNLHLQKEQLLSQQRLVLSNIPDVEAQLKVQAQQRENILVQKRRIEKLFEREAATQKQVDDVNAGLDLLDAQINATEVKKANIKEQAKSLDSQIEIVKHKILECQIISPVDGVVLSQYSRKGEMATIGKPLFSLAALNDIRLRVYVSGAQLPHIKLGQKVKVLIDESETQNKTLEGEIVWISSEAEFTPKTIQTKEERVNLVYAVKIKVPNNGELKAGMPGEVVFGER